MDGMLSLGMGGMAGGKEPLFWEFNSLFSRCSILFQEFGLVQVPRNLWVPRSLCEDGLCTRSSVSEKKTVLHIACFAYSVITIIIFFPFVVLLNHFYLNPRVLFFPTLLPSHCRGSSEWAAAWSSLPAAGLNHDTLRFDSLLRLSHKCNINFISSGNLMLIWLKRP